MGGSIKGQGVLKNNIFLINLWAQEVFNLQVILPPTGSCVLADKNNGGRLAQVTIPTTSMPHLLASVLERWTSFLQLCCMKN